MRSHTVNEKGMTLVEILAALVILGIVFVGFMTIFPQMTNFNEKTGTILESMNDARILLDDFKTSSYTIEELKEQGYIEDGNYLVKYETGDEPEIKIEYEINKNADLPTTGNNKQSSLHLVHITISQKNRTISETFGYIEVKK